MSIDLHTHTVYSDGTATPEELVDEARRAGLKVIAVTDHDAIAGVEPAIRYAGDDIEVIPGIEMGCFHESEEGIAAIEILGYFVDYQSNWLYDFLEIDEEAQAVLKEVEQLRRARLSLGDNRTLDDRKTQRGTFSVKTEDGRILQHTYRIPSSAEAIEAIRAAGGVPILSHPGRYKKDYIIPQLIPLGLAGIEVYYGGYSDEQVEHYYRIAKEHDLLMTGGSDYHALVKPHVKIGRRTCPPECLEALRAARP